MRRCGGVEQELKQWVQQWQSGPASGTEAAKQDFSAWESLRDDLCVTEILLLIVIRNCGDYLLVLL